MKVTIITATYNSEKYIIDCINSVNQQGWPLIQHVFIDGGSTDSTLSIVEKFSKREKIVLSEPDNGIYDAMNKGIFLSDGDVVGILNSDDLFKDSNVVESIVNTIKKKECDCVYGDLEFVSQSNINQVVRFWKSEQFHKNSFSVGWHPPHPTFYVKKEIYDKYGSFDIDLEVSADFELMLRFLEKHNVSNCYLNKTFVKMRYGGESTGSLKKIVLGNKNIMKAFKKNDIPVSIFYPFFRIFSKLPQFMKK